MIGEPRDVNAAKIEERLIQKGNQALKGLQGRRQPHVTDIFTKRLYISPDHLQMVHYLRRRPLAAFNPGALLQNGELLVFPRLIFDYYGYTSSIGLFRLPLEEVLKGRLPRPIETQLLLWPEALWEFRGCEDPRVPAVGERSYILYTGVGQPYGNGRRQVLALAELGPTWEVRHRGYFTIVGSEGERFLPTLNKDSAFLEVQGSRATLLTRPSVGGLELCWRGEADLETLTLEEATLKPVLAFEPWEEKMGWSTNTVPVAEDEYLVGWHAVLKEDYSYRNGLALVNGRGELLALSDYLLAPRGMVERYGDRPLVVFGCGLLLHENQLLWLGGISDYAIGIFIADWDAALQELRPVA
jgi:predicted GH43/DUF377 family glycosyl hydrolase